MVLKDLLEEAHQQGLHDGRRGGDRALHLHGEPRGETWRYGSGSLPQNSHEGSGGTKIELPELGSTGEVTPMALGDWLTMIGPFMKDISGCSAVWWETTGRAAQELYQTWRSSTPLARVQIEPRLPEAVARDTIHQGRSRGVWPFY